jgi:hypothetical protein
VKKLMEGNSVIQCRALQGKMINGDEIDISAAHVAVDAVYGARTNIEASDDITVGLCRGMIEVSDIILVHSSMFLRRAAGCMDGRSDTFASWFSQGRQAFDVLHLPLMQIGW